VAGVWKRLHDEELGSLYASSNIRVIKLRMRWTGHVAYMGDMRNMYNVLVGKSEGRRPLGRHRLRCEDNIGMDLREIGWESVNWIHVA
jgi:hypothetical protein